MMVCMFCGASCWAPAIEFRGGGVESSSSSCQAVEATSDLVGSQIYITVSPSQDGRVIFRSQVYTAWGQECLVIPISWIRQSWPPCWISFPWISWCLWQLLLPSPSSRELLFSSTPAIDPLEHIPERSPLSFPQLDR